MASARTISGLLVVLWLLGLVCGLPGQQPNASHVHVGQQPNATHVHVAEQSSAPSIHAPVLGWPAGTPETGPVLVATPLSGTTRGDHGAVPTLENFVGVASSPTVPLVHQPVLLSPLHPHPILLTSTMATVTFFSEHTLFSTAAATYTLVVDHFTTVTEKGGEAKATIAPFKTTIVEPFTVTSYQLETVTSVKEHTTTTANIGSTASAMSPVGGYTRTLTFASTIEVMPSHVSSSSAAAPSTASTSDNSNHINTGLIVGICIGVCCVFLALFAFGCFWMRRHHKQQVKDQELKQATWQSAAMNLVANDTSMRGEKAASSSTGTDAPRESPTKPAPGPRTVHGLHSSTTPHRRSISTQPSCRSSLPTPLEEQESEHDNDDNNNAGEDDPFLSPEEKAARSPAKSAAASIVTSPSPIQLDVEAQEARRAMLRQASIELQNTATFAATMERQERELKKAQEWIDRFEKERQERKERECRLSFTSSVDGE